MAYREHGMWEILDVLKRHHRGESQRRIAAATGRGRKTIRAYIREAKKLGWSKEVPPDEALASRVAQRRQPGPSSSEASGDTQQPGQSLRHRSSSRDEKRRQHHRQHRRRDEQLIVMVDEEVQRGGDACENKRELSHLSQRDPADQTGPKAAPQGEHRTGGHRDLEEQNRNGRTQNEDRPRSPRIRYREACRPR